MKSRYFLARFTALLGAAVALGGCSLTQVESEHSLLRGDEPGAAKVYFIRPETERRMGYADNGVVVELNSEKLMTLGRGEYTLVSLVPRDYVIGLRNMTEAGPYVTIDEMEYTPREQKPSWNVKEITRQYRFDFAAGETYFVVVAPVDGEFRGVHFKASVVDRFEASQLAATLRPVGRAKSAKITTM